VAAAAKPYHALCLSTLDKISHTHHAPYPPTQNNHSRLSLSTNSIDRIAGLQPSASAAGGGAGAAGAPSSASPLPRLEALSLGRNLIKRIEGLEGVAETLRELWLSYNQIEKLVRFCRRGWVCDGSLSLSRR
jgi:Leucine-rich repeat (LRR) protein